MHEIVIVKTWIIGKEKLRIIRNNRTVEVIIAFALINIIAHAGIENEVNALVKKIFNMPVSQLCRIAYRIGRNCMLSQIVHIP